jgi:hypothetical protein
MELWAPDLDEGILVIIHKCFKPAFLRATRKDADGEQPRCVQSP